MYVKAHLNFVLAHLSIECFALRITRAPVTHDMEKCQSHSNLLWGFDVSWVAVSVIVATKYCTASIRTLSVNCKCAFIVIY